MVEIGTMETVSTNILGSLTFDFTFTNFCVNTVSAHITTMTKKFIKMSLYKAIVIKIRFSNLPLQAVVIINIIVREDIVLTIGYGKSEVITVETKKYIPQDITKCTLLLYLLEKNMHINLYIK